MGNLVRLESKRFLLQREDFPAALKSFKKLAADVPDYFRDPSAVRAARDLKSALEKGELLGELDGHGDLVGVEFVGEKLPPRAPDDFPDRLVLAWKKLAPNAVFHFWLEGSRTNQLTLRGGKLFSHELGALPWGRFELVGLTPECVPGQSVEIRVRLVSDKPDDRRRLALEGCKDWEGVLAFEHVPEDMQVGEDAVVRVAVERNAHHWSVDADHFTLKGKAGDDFVMNSLPLHVRDAIGNVDTAHEVVATEWTLEGSASGVYLPAKQVKAAHEQVRRYCARHKTERGGEFLARVEAAPDLGAALREASFEPAFDASGTLHGLAFKGDRLAGGERHLHGMLASYARLTGFTGATYAAMLKVAFRHAPDVWATLVFHSGGMRWWRTPRR